MAYDAFVVFTGEPKVQGETTDKTFAAKKALEIYSFSLGASNPSTIGSAGGGGGAGKVSLSSFNFMKKTDTSSPVLFTACATGSHFDKVEVFLRKAGGTAGQEPYLTYTFDEAFVDSIQWSGSSGGDDTPSESVSIAYGKITIDYKPQKEKGTLGDSVMAYWDVRQNAPVK
jgi:type VI secretion system secreted protein Hcp